jgi:hypothetical protein
MLGKKTTSDASHELTPAQIALIDQRVREGVRAEREAEAAALKQKHEPIPTTPETRYGRLDPELEALFLRAFDSAGTRGLHGDEQLSGAVLSLYPDDGREPPREALLVKWRGCPWGSLDWMERVSEKSLVVSAIRNLDRNRKNPNWLAEELAQRNRLDVRARENARYWADSRRPSDLTVEELEALLEAKRAESVSV